MSDRPSLPRSSAFAGLEWLGERVPYPEPGVRGDTYPVTWAADGELYASSGDPDWKLPGSKVKGDGLDVEKFSGAPPGHRIEKVNHMPDYTGWGGAGIKPSGLLSVGGVLYLAVQNLYGKKPPAHGRKCQHGSDAVIVASRDFGKTWEPDICEQRARGPMFPGCRFGGPAFVQCGRDHAGAPDEFIYAVSGDQWDNGSELRLGRVPRDRILETGAWEFFAGMDDSGRPEWRRYLETARPVLVLDRWLGLPEMVYLSRLKRYLLLTWRLHQDFTGDAGSALLVFESPEPWGPFSLVYQEDLWEGAREINPYCPRLPLKWFDPAKNEGWLLFSGGWEPVGINPHYRAQVRKFRLQMS